MKPSIGRIVRYIVPEHMSKATAGEQRAAIITRVHSETCVNLFVYFDGDGVENGRVTSVCFGTEPGQCMWPERVQ